MRTNDEIDQKIAALEARRRELHELYHVFLTGNAAPRANSRSSLDSAAQYLKQMSDEDLDIDRALCILRWVRGTSELFIWR